MSLTLAILGRPNVGKSTLFNRLVGRRLALVDDTPGVTRDWREGEGAIADLAFRLLDTAGLDEGGAGSLPGRMRVQTEAALAHADIALFLVDARAGITPMDEYFAQWLRGRNTPVILVANKGEGRRGEEGAYEAYGLGLGDPVVISAEHGEGLGELYQAIVEAARAARLDPYGAADDSGDEEADETPPEGPLPDEGDMEFQFTDPEAGSGAQRPLRLAVIGRPNAGKSTLINHLLGEERLIAGPEPGLTRDSISIDWRYGDRPVKLFDTAGLRRRARVTDKLEKLSVADALRAVRFAEVVVLLVDAAEGLHRQDLKLAELVAEEGRALVIALNKWDRVEDRLAVQREVNDSLTRSLPQLRGVTTVPVSALTGAGVGRLMPAVLEVYELWNSRIPTGEFNRWLAATTEAHAPPADRGRPTRIRYGAQIKTRPPTFAIFANRPKLVGEGYRRYLANELRRAFELPGVPLRFMVRGSKAAAARKRKTKRQRSSAPGRK